MPSIAIVVLDTLRKDTFEEYFDWLPGHRFDNAWSTSHWTVPAHGSLFTGQHASEVGSVAKSPTLDYPGPVLAEELAEAGYTTRAFSSNPNIAPPFDFDRGFESFNGSWRHRSPDQDDIFAWGRALDKSDRRPSIAFLDALLECIRGEYNTMASLRYGVQAKQRSIGLEYGPADDGAQETLEYVRNTDFGDREFFFTNLMEVHSPYKPPAEYRTVDLSTHPFRGGLRETITENDVNNPEHQRQAYEDCAQYLSDVYQELFAELQDSFDWIVTLSDHGELFGEHGVWRHGFGVYPELVSVPLSVYTGKSEVTRSDELVSLADLYGAILEPVQDVKDETPITWLRSNGREEALTEYHGITHQRKVEYLLEDGFDEGTIEAYEQPLAGLATEEAYAYQTLEDFVGDPELESRLHMALEERDVRSVSAEVDLAEETVDQLEELGYI
jgi:arylsulfatase A-like enzyme